MHETAIDLVLVPCGFVRTASVLLILEMMLNLLKYIYIYGILPKFFLVLSSITVGFFNADYTVQKGR